MLADDVRLDLVARTRLNGKREVATYFTNYSKREDGRFVPGLVEGRPAAIAHDVDDPFKAPTYFVLLTWGDDRVVSIRDFRHARYTIEGAEVVISG